MYIKQVVNQKQSSDNYVYCYMHLKFNYVEIKKFNYVE